MKEGNSADMVRPMLARSLHHCKEEFCLENSALVVAGSDASENLLMIGMDFLSQNQNSLALQIQVPSNY